jgi:hypothetical protein
MEHPAGLAYRKMVKRGRLVEVGPGRETIGRGVLAGVGGAVGASVFRPCDPKDLTRRRCMG